MRISNRAQRVRASGIRRMFDLGARLVDPLDLSIGQPDFIPPIEAREAVIKAIREGSSRYTVTQGVPELNEAVLELIERRSGVRPESSLVTVGVAGGLALGLMTLIDPHERLIVFSGASSPPGNTQSPPDCQLLKILRELSFNGIVLDCRFLAVPP